MFKALAIGFVIIMGMVLLSCYPAYMSWVTAYKSMIYAVSTPNDLVLIFIDSLPFDFFIILVWAAYRAVGSSRFGGKHNAN
jgi:hypothetical protein